MMLHGVDAPNITWQDSLSNDNPDANRYTLCLANPPFAGSLDKETISKSLLQMANTTKTELLFLALFLRTLDLGGRCASIVPDGVLFGNSNAHKAIRKELVDNQRLQAVISMPSGVFQPYAGVSTAILIFTKTNTPNSTDRVWFYEMHADGFTLDQKRTPCTENDIPDVISRFHNLDAEANRSRKDQSFFVPVEEIRANDYDLTFNKYKEVERKVVEYDAPETILAHIDDLQSQIAEGLAIAITSPRETSAAEKVAPLPLPKQGCAGELEQRALQKARDRPSWEFLLISEGSVFPPRQGQGPL